MNKKLCLLLAGVLVAVPLAEGAARLGLRLAGKPYDSGVARRRIEALLGSMDEDLLPRARVRATDSTGAQQALALHPFYGWETPMGSARVAGDEQLFEERGEREKLYTVVIVGGSVAGLFTESDTGGSDVLERALEADPRFAGRDVRILGHGRGAFKQPQQLFVLTWLFSLGILPDAVVNIDGFNEVAIANQNRRFEAHPLFPSAPQWRSLVRGNAAVSSFEELHELLDSKREFRSIASHALDRGYARSALLGRWTLSRLFDARERMQAAQKKYVRRVAIATEGTGRSGPSFAGGDEEAVELGVHCWSETSLDIEAMCRRRSIHYLHVLQPTLHDPGAKIVTSRELETGGAVDEWKTAVELGYPKMRAEGKRLAAEGVAFCDASRIFEGIDRTLYYDACHLEREGNVLLADAIATAFLDSLDTERTVSTDRTVPRTNRSDSALAESKR